MPNTYGQRDLITTMNYIICNKSNFLKITKWNNYLYVLSREWSELQLPYNLYLELNTSVPPRSINSSEIITGGVHKFPQNLEAITKSFLPER